MPLHTLMFGAVFFFFLISHPTVWCVNMFDLCLSKRGWEATGGKILTLDKLQRRGWHLPNRCYLCERDEESAHHILLHCQVVSHLWVLFLSLVGLSWVFPKMVKEALLN